MLCAREMRGNRSRDIALTLCVANVARSSAWSAGSRKLNTRAPSRSVAASTSGSGCTARTTSASLRASRSTSSAPTATYDSSRYPADAPAPRSIATLNPAARNRVTASGTHATRRSYSADSRGTTTFTPETYLRRCGSAREDEVAGAKCHNDIVRRDVDTGDLDPGRKTRKPHRHHRLCQDLGAHGGRHRRSVRHRERDGSHHDGVAKERDTSCHPYRRRGWPHRDDVGPRQLVGLTRDRAGDRQPGDAGRSLKVGERNGHRTRHPLDRSGLHVTAKRLRRRDPQVEEIEPKHGTPGDPELKHIVGHHLDVAVVARHHLGEERKTLHADFRSLREVRVASDGGRDLVGRETRGLPVTCVEQPPEDDDHHDEPGRSPHQPTMMRATTSTAGGTTTIGKVAATGQATTPSGTRARAARAPTASTTATNATTAPVPSPNASAARLTKTPAPTPNAMPPGTAAHSGTPRWIGSTPTATPVTATATSVVPCGPPRTASSTAAAMPRAPVAIDAASAFVNLSRPSRRPNWMTKARITKPASTPASARTVAGSWPCSSTPSAVAAAAPAASAPLACPSVVRCALRNQPAISTSWTTRSAAASAARLPDEAASTTTARIEVGRPATTAISRGRAEGTLASSHCPVKAGGSGLSSPVAPGTCGSRKCRGYLRSRRGNQMETGELLSLDQIGWAWTICIVVKGGLDEHVAAPDQRPAALLRGAPRARPAAAPGAGRTRRSVGAARRTPSRRRPRGRTSRPGARPLVVPIAAHHRAVLPALLGHDRRRSVGGDRRVGHRRRPARHHRTGRGRGSSSARVGSPRARVAQQRRRR